MSNPLATMHAIQQQAVDLQRQTSNLMGLSADGKLVTTVTESIADRIIRIRTRMLAVGIPVAVGTGVVTTAVFAGAFGLAKTERVWAPAFLLGGVATLAALVSVAVVAKTATAAANDAQKAAAAAQVTVDAIAVAARAAPAAY